MAIPIPNKLSAFLNTSFLLLLCLHLTTHPSTSSDLSAVNHHHRILRQVAAQGCDRLHDFPDSESKCLYIQTEPSCRPKGYINYLQVFYCTYGPYPLVGHSLLLLWLAVLFYLLGNTAAQYFCSTLDGLSKVLNLSPTIAGVTLLSLGNGAPDVFAGVVSFTRSGNADVGLNSILGGAFFVSSVVVGVISFFVSSESVSIDRPSFYRDVLFFIVALLSLLLVIIVGKINFFGAIAFVSIYLIYVCSVSAMQILSRKKQSMSMSESESDSESSLPVSVSVSILDFPELGIPMLGYVDEQKFNLADKNMVHDQKHREQELNDVVPWSFNQDPCHLLSKLWQILELPLYLPRRLTIPLVCEAHWSKPYGVASSGLAPLLLAALCTTQSRGPTTNLVIYIAAGLTGTVLANIAYATTKKTSPPKKFLFPWLAGGFVMSVTWTYITAEELVSLLVSLGYILGISASVLGLTVLAWGNSLGDLIANVAMAINGGPDGAQIAISGCYAGPMFNTLVGLGLSLVFSSWSEAYVIPRDHSLYGTIGFLIAGLLWALVILPRKNMRLDRLLGCGLVAIYMCFLFLRLAQTLGILQLDD